MEFEQRYGPWALVLGASEGIGASFARQIADRGVNVVLAARRSGPLQDTAAAIAVTGREVRTVAVDLTADGMMDQLNAVCADIEIGLVVYNAGAMHGAELFHDESLDKLLTLVRLNCDGPIKVCHHFGQSMIERGRGGIILLSSMAALAGSGRIATYSATKAFDLVLAEGLWDELRPRGVDVLGLVAGATRTPAMERSGTQIGTEALPGMDPEDVAREGLANLANGPLWVAGDDNRAGFDFLRVQPRTQIIEFMAMGTRAVFGLDADGAASS